MGRLIGSWAICLYSFLDHQHPHQHPSSASSAFITHHCSSLLIIATATATATTTTTTGAHGLGAAPGHPPGTGDSFVDVKDLTTQTFSEVAAAAAAATAAAAAAEKSPEFFQNA